MLSLVGAAVALLLTAAAPAVLSTPRGLRAVLAVVNRIAPGHISVQQASLGWRRPIIIDQLKLMEPERLGGETLVDVQQISSTRSLWSIVTGKEFDVVVTAPFVDCLMAPDGQLKFVRLLTEWQVVREAKAHHKPHMPPDNTAPVDPAASKAKGPESAPLNFTAEGRLMTAQLYASDGVLQLPIELQQVVGENLHAAVLIGAKNLRDDAADFGVDAGWVDKQRAPKAGAAGMGRALDPTVVVVNSEHVNAELSGWRTSTGLLLRKPVSASVDYTPALAKFYLSRINPLLADSVSVEEGGTVRVDVTPLHDHVPAESLAVRVAPMKLVVGRGNLLGDAIGMLQLRDGRLGKLDKMKRLEVWTSAAHAEVFRNGPVVTKRIDLLVGSGNKGVHLALWGQVDPTTNQLSMTLGIPADTLALAGIKGLPAEAMFPVAVRGTVNRPRVDWIGASRRLAALAVKQRSVDIATEDQPASLRASLLKDALKGRHVIPVVDVGTPPQV
ncbi:hypothetical protein WJX72_009837 [[Myrmecia] bisecta]|uniref:DUF3971 domain-containing protein n=1 Tax=[Myrmecia] bisecta TaxID=41462 RepID=A0AAW1QB02_9CHLO